MGRGVNTYIHMTWKEVEVDGKETGGVEGEQYGHAWMREKEGELKRATKTHTYTQNTKHTHTQTQRRRPKWIQSPTPTPSAAYRSGFKCSW